MNAIKIGSLVVLLMSLKNNIYASSQDGNLFAPLPLDTLHEARNILAQAYDPHFTNQIRAYEQYIESEPNAENFRLTKEINYFSKENIINVTLAIIRGKKNDDTILHYIVTFTAFNMFNVVEYAPYDFLFEEGTMHLKYKYRFNDYMQKPEFFENEDGKIDYKYVSYPINKKKNIKVEQTKYSHTASLAYRHSFGMQYAATVEEISKKIEEKLGNS